MLTVGFTTVEYEFELLCCQVMLVKFPVAVSVEEAPLQIVGENAVNITLNVFTPIVCVPIHPFELVAVAVYVKFKDGDTTTGLTVELFGDQTKVV